MMSTNHGKIRVLVVAATVIVMALWSLSSADDGGRDSPDEKRAGSIKAIERRLEELQTLVGPSTSPVSGRIDNLERGLRDLTKAMGGTAWSSVESNIREAKKTLTELTRQREKQSEDLQQLKQTIRKLGRIGNEIAKLRRAVGEMERRMRRLESRS